MTGKETYLEMFEEGYAKINTHVKKNGWSAPPTHTRAPHTHTRSLARSLALAGCRREREKRRRC
eukprot:982621-Rhodomonas_salina.1